MLLSRKQLAVSGAASTEENRMAINCIRINADGKIQATDGHIAVIFTPGETLDEKEFPSIEGLTVADDSTLAEQLVPFSLHRDSCATISKTIPKKSRMPILNLARLDVVQTNKNGCAVIGVTDLESPQVLRPKKLDMQFPNMSKVEPQGDPALIVGIGIEALEKLIKTLKALEMKNFKLSLYGNETGPMAIDACNSAGDSVHCLLMPCLID